MLKKIPVHPLLFALYPAIALAVTNIDQIRPENALRVALLSLLGGVLLYALAWFVLKRKQIRRSALLASLWLLFFFAYGHVYQLLEGRGLLGFVYGRHRYLIVLWLMLLVLGTWLILKVIKRTREITVLLNVASLALLAIPLAQILWFEAQLNRDTPPVPTTVAGLEATAPGPDIYYIVLDGYSRSDVLQELYGLDISPTLNELESLGFVIPECAQANYGITAFSMFASLNMDYLDAYAGVFPLGSNADKVDYAPFRDYLRHSKARQFLAERGYQMVTFVTGYHWLDVDDSDIFITENNNPLRQYSQMYSLSNFEEMFLRTTALRVLAEGNASFFGPLNQRIITPAEQHYEWVKFALDSLTQVPEIPGKKFVYFHVLAPHDPYVFAPDGSFRADVTPTGGVDNEIPGYPDEVTYLNKRILEIVRELIAKSPTPPIIVIQGDHGWDPRYRLQILNAYYLPETSDGIAPSATIYPTITPVNTFRLIFDHYFGGSFGLLPDHSYFSVGGDFPAAGIEAQPYQLTPVSPSCVGDGLK